jgi:hypothetical protein
MVEGKVLFLGRLRMGLGTDEKAQKKAAYSKYPPNFLGHGNYYYKKSRGIIKSVL